MKSLENVPGKNFFETLRCYAEFKLSLLPGVCPKFENFLIYAFLI
jgi:hypothetical protein